MTTAASPLASPRRFTAGLAGGVVSAFRGVWLTVRSNYPAVLAIGLILGAWYVVTAGETAEARLVSPVLLPTPREVIEAFPLLVSGQGLAASMVASLQRVLSGFALATLIGVPLGVLAGVSSWFRSFTAPYALFMRNIPVAVLIPLTLLWFGIDEKQKIMFIFIATAPFVFTATAAAIVAVHDRFIDTARTLGASARQVVTKVKVPMALPDIYIALRSLFGMAFGYIMLAELINAERGLGYLINTAQRRGDRPVIFAILIVIGVTAWFIDKFLLFFQRGFFQYRENQE